MESHSKIEHLSKEDVIKNGSVFTPEHIVRLVFDISSPYITPDAVIGDLGSGYGAFIDVFKNLSNRCFGTDCDEVSIKLLNQNFNNIPFYHENSLENVHREKYFLADEDELFIIGNPPFNDTTSIYKKGEKGILICDSDIQSRDFGISFLKAYNKLQAKYVCVLHPLAYLIKKNNFNSLKEFKDNYKLLRGVIFSSAEFESIEKSKAEFPVVAALYERCDAGMDYEHIKNFKFEIYNSRKQFVLSSFKTIDGIVNKYPKKEKKGLLQFYTLRDMNALLRNAAFVDGNISNGLDVTLDNLFEYAWLFFLKNEFSPKKYTFIYGNLSPLWTEKLARKDFKRAVVAYAFNNCTLISKYYSKEQIEKVYGKITTDYDILFKGLKKLYL